MTFTKGNKLSPGRLGYELEQEQLELMRELASKDLKLVKKIYDGKATERDFKILLSLQTRVVQYLNKLHASKSDPQTIITNNTLIISPETKEKVKALIGKVINGN